MSRQLSDGSANDFACNIAFKAEQRKAWYDTYKVLCMLATIHTCYLVAGRKHACQPFLGRRLVQSRMRARRTLSPGTRIPIRAGKSVRRERAGGALPELLSLLDSARLPP